MRERDDDGVATAARASATALRVSLDLHAHHHFTRAAATDGSMAETVEHGGRLRRRVAYGIWEGLMPAATAHAGAAAGLSGGRLPSDAEVADAELAAIHAYLQRVVDESPTPARERVLILSDCKSVLRRIESAWRAGDARKLRGWDRGAELESLCTLRSQLETVIFVWCPSHVGISPNAYADAAAKAHLSDTGCDAALWEATCTHARARPCLHEVRSDYDADGVLLTANNAGSGAWVPWDRRIFTAARRRLGRHVHSTLARGLRDTQLLDHTFIGRLGHTSESRTYAEVARAGQRCAPLDRREDDPMGRMVHDSGRVSIVMTARQGQVLGVRGAQDAWWGRRRAAEKVPGRAAREGALGCACCGPGLTVYDTSDACATCHGWTRRGERGAWCATCGCGTPDSTGTPTPRRDDERKRARPDSLMGVEGWRTVARRQRRLGPVSTATDTEGATGENGDAHRWVGFAGLAQTTVERLLRAGGTRDEDAESSALPLADELADLRHVLAAQCADEAVNAGASALRDAIASLSQVVVRHGGGRVRPS